MTKFKEEDVYIFNKERECMSREEFRELQLRRLKKVVRYAYDNVPFYRNLYDKNNVSPDDIKTLEDIQLLPFITKDDLRNTYPFDLQAAPKEDWVEVHSTSGTTGIPTVAAYTQKDLDIWAECTARGLASVGVHKKDIVNIAYGFGLFTGGHGAQYGAQKIGALAVPMSSGNTKKQMNFLKDFPADFLCCTPSYALYIAESFERAGIDPKTVPIKGGVFGAEMWTEEIRQKLEDKFGISAQNIYGLTEVMGPGVSTECHIKDGMHIAEDHFYPEIIDPNTLEVLPEGETGEIVFTSLTKTGMPVIRYRTKDITSLNYDKCECGRTTVRMSRIIGRSDDMLKVKGVIVFPKQIEEVIMAMDELSPAYQIIVSRPDTLDEIEVQVEIDQATFSDSMTNLEEFKYKVGKEIKEAIGIGVKVTLAEPYSIPRSEGKAKRVIDKRNFN
ncbi:phenylacetate--CoA ligase [Methanosphaera sp. Vir-13MRS]|jgi:phenylacetate-CoA ligase|uniref:phenylacetate--CoA ligase family protein n=1 Tax=Candidatus Methanosphaera massiliense TaxID=3017187 RepID=UPI0023803BBA|nr:phenylacetate--CoA ligase [Candidatus Methanosphaera massiliense]MDE4079071.1 phenylacetate--CoA ligase [Candidatus Methanosphaera massiliense]